ncbi:MAG: ester cyclase [Acidobacteriaceae bacterium]|nr:ester cyclase [Acidobacteriaceae bacterium]
MTSNVAETNRAQRESIVNEHIEAEAIRHDVTAALKTFKHPRYEVPALGAVADGTEAVNGLLGALLTAFPDFYLEKTALHHADDAVIVECRFGGTHRGEWAGIAATGKMMEVSAALIFLFDGEGLICEKVYFDHATVLRQLVLTI